MPVSPPRPPLDHALERLQPVEAVGVEAVRVGVEVAERQGLVDLRAGLVLQVRRAARDRQGGPGHEGDAQLCGAVVHPAGVVPRVCQVLVVEDRHGPAGQPDHPAHLLEEVASRVHLAPPLVGSVVPVLGDDQHAVDRKLSDLPSRRGGPVAPRRLPKRQGGPDAGEELDAVVAGKLDSDVLGMGLVDVHGDDVYLRLDHAGRCREPLHEPRDEQVGVGAGEECCDDGGDLLT